MGYTTLKAALDAVVRTNGQQQITGANLNGVMTTLLQGVDVLDRANPADTSGMNKVVLKKNKTFAEQVTGTNTIYEIRDDFSLAGATFALPDGCVLHFVGGKLHDGGLTGMETFVSVVGKSAVFDGVTLGGNWANRNIYASWWEDSDNVVSDSITAMASNGGSYYVEFEKGKTYTYTYHGNTDAGGYTDPIIRFQNCENVEVNLNGSIQRIDTTSSMRYDIFQFYNCGFAHIHDGELVGDRLTHDYSTISGTHEWGYGIHIAGKKVLVERIICHEMTGDAIYAGALYDYSGQSWISHLEECVVRDCHLHHCRRQGVSFGYSDADAVCVVENCIIENIGTSNNVIGTAPMSGIDIESEVLDKVNGNYIIRGTTIRECTRTAVISTSECTTSSITIDGCNLAGTINVDATKVVVKNTTYSEENFQPDVVLFVLKNAKVMDSSFSFRVYDSATAGKFFNGVECRNCKFEDITPSDVSQYQSVVFRGTSVSFTDCQISNILGDKSSSYPGTTIGVFGFASTTTAMNYTFTRCDIINCSAAWNAATVVFKDCTVMGGTYLHLDLCQIDGCTFFNVLRTGSKYHDAIGATFYNSVVKEDFTGATSVACALVNGGNTSPIKIVNGRLEVSDDGENISANNIRVIGHLSTIVYDVEQTLSLAGVSAFNCVISGKRTTFDGTGENNSYLVLS